ncbi:hypothetical protein AB0J86_05535 [Micromonospora sp. NPDC049559]|uniref:hypothetical protein n=1 Tax=Micromonospora sp. NPDC049559 TaxID=3155923 RepID=UPI003431A1DD
MDDIETPAMQNIRRWLKGEIVNRTTGIRMLGGPRHGRFKIVELGADGQPPPGLRTGAFNGDTWSVYILSATGGEGAEHPWTYRFAGTEPRLRDTSRTGGDCLGSDPVMPFRSNQP